MKKLQLDLGFLAGRFEEGISTRTRRWEVVEAA